MIFSKTAMLLGRGAFLQQQVVRHVVRRFFRGFMMNQKTAVFLVEIGFRKVADCPSVLTVAKGVQIFVAHFGAERCDKFGTFKAYLRRGAVLCFEIAD